MESNIQSTTTVKSPKRYTRYDVVTLKCDGSKKIVLRKDGTLKYDTVSNKFLSTKGDEWFEYTEDIIQYLDQSIQEKGYIEL
jgi:hypothetical protein